MENEVKKEETIEESANEVQTPTIVSSVPVNSMELDVTEELLVKADQMVKSGLLPDSVQTAQGAIVIMQYGKELGFPPMASFNNIYVVNGKPSLATKATAGLLYKGGVRWQVLQDDEPVTDENGQVVDRVTTIEMVRDGMKNKFTFRWTDAMQAGLAKRDVWVKYRQNMMYWRCFSMLADRVAPDLLLGMQDAAVMLDVNRQSYTQKDDGSIIIG
jgi:hypothetical protein